MPIIPLPRIIFQLKKKINKKKSDGGSFDYRIESFSVIKATFFFYQIL
jgi:hypothetical protein